MAEEIADEATRENKKTQSVEDPAIELNDQSSVADNGGKDLAEDAEQQKKLTMSEELEIKTE